MTEEYSAKVKNLQTAMVKKLSGNLAPIGTLKKDWDELLYSLSNDNPLSQAEIQGISTMQQLFVVLMAKNFIDYGKYHDFVERLRLIHPNMASTVQDYETKILDQIRRDSESTKAKLQNANEANGGHVEDGGN